MCPPLAHYRSALRAAEVHSTLAFSGDREGSSGEERELGHMHNKPLKLVTPRPSPVPISCRRALSIISTVQTLFDDTSFVPPMWSLNNLEIAEKSFIDIYLFYTIKYKMKTRGARSKTNIISTILWWPSINFSFGAKWAKIRIGHTHNMSAHFRRRAP